MKRQSMAPQFDFFWTNSIKPVWLEYVRGMGVGHWHSEKVVVVALHKSMSHYAIPLSLGTDLYVKLKPLLIMELSVLNLTADVRLLDVKIF